MMLLGYRPACVDIDVMIIFLSYFLKNSMISCPIRTGARDEGITSPMDLKSPRRRFQTVVLMVTTGCKLILIVPPSYSISSSGVRTEITEKALRNERIEYSITPLEDKSPSNFLHFLYFFVPCLKISAPCLNLRLRPPAIYGGIVLLVERTVGFWFVLFCLRNKTLIVCYSLLQRQGFSLSSLCSLSSARF